MYSISTIQNLTGASFQLFTTNTEIEHLGYDSRSLPFGAATLFFALQTQHRDGHIYLQDAYKKGVRNFVVSREQDTTTLSGSNILLVANTLMALQQVAAFHRSHFSIPVIGITGSNGKTIVKEWLYQLLQDDYNIVRSPKSYNSQIGVPLSVWQMNESHTLAIFEAGISQPGEMQALRDIIQPTVGVLTNVGAAHDAGFSSRTEKAEEKLKLLQEVDVAIFDRDNLLPHISLQEKYFSDKTILLDWSFGDDAPFHLTKKSVGLHETRLQANYKEEELSVILPFTDEASIQNAIHCWCVMVYLGYNSEVINERFQRLHAVDMRLQLKHGINHCLIINDSYSADVTSLKIALQFLRQQSSGLKRTVILSDFYESGETEETLYSEVAELLASYGVNKVVGIGEAITRNLEAIIQGFLNWKPELFLFTDTENFIAHFKSSSFWQECILIKGARRFGFERIAQLFDVKVHQTLLEINLNAIVHNLKQYRSLLQPHTKIMAMVKAFAYGSGGAEIAGVLQYNNIDYLGVAYADEGIELRKAGITVPIMVMNVDEESFAALVEYNLQPVLYASHLLHAFESYIKSTGLSYFGVHLELETGMNRLGFPVSEAENLAHHFAQSGCLKIETVFTHLAASEDAAQDDFTQQQASLFLAATKHLEQKLSYFFLKHIANSAAIIRHPHLQLDMVRLGIGLYGIEIATHTLALQPVATLRTTIAQLKYLHEGDTVSYNRRGAVHKNAVIATVRIGYADGYSRRFGNGVGKMLVRGKIVPVIGSVCMDMTMLDVTGVPGVQEGDTVIIFGEQLPVQQVSAWIDTIPYELMTSVSQRVKRIYFQE